MGRRIPGQLLPHTATIEPYLGASATGPLYGEALDPVRCLFDGAGSALGRVISGIGTDRTVQARVYFDSLPVALPLLSRVTGSPLGPLLVVGLTPFSGGGVSYLQVLLGT